MILYRGYVNVVQAVFISVIGYFVGATRRFGYGGQPWVFNVPVFFYHEFCETSWGAAYF